MRLNYGRLNLVTVDSMIAFARLLGDLSNLQTRVFLRRFHPALYRSEMQDVVGEDEDHQSEQGEHSCEGQSHLQSFIKPFAANRLGDQE